MRLLALVSLLSASAALAAPATPPARTTTVVPWHPHAWHPPAAVTPAAGIRLEPEAAAPSQGIDLQGMAAARRQALASVAVRTRRDGSRYAVLGGAVRSYTVATIGPDGKLTQTCVHSEDKAKQLVAAPAPKKE